MVLTGLRSELACKELKAIHRVLVGEHSCGCSLGTRVDESYCSLFE